MISKHSCPDKYIYSSCYESSCILLPFSCKVNTILILLEDHFVAWCGSGRAALSVAASQRLLVVLSVFCVKSPVCVHVCVHVIPTRDVQAGFLPHAPCSQGGLQIHLYHDKAGNKSYWLQVRGRTRPGQAANQTNNHSHAQSRLWQFWSKSACLWTEEGNRGTQRKLSRHGEKHPNFTQKGPSEQAGSKPEPSWRERACSPLQHRASTIHFYLKDNL